MSSENPVTNKDYSKIQESVVSSYLCWAKVVASGARTFHPGDVISPNWLGECKTHVKKVDKIKFELRFWKKIQEEAKAIFKVPVLIVDDGTQKVDNTWCLYPVWAGSSEVPKEEFTNKVRTNIIFDPKDLKKDRIYIVNFGDSCVHVSSLEVFDKMFHGR